MAPCPTSRESGVSCSEPCSHNALVQVVRYERRDLRGVVALCEAEGWSSYYLDPERVHRVLTAPGVTAVVAREGDEVIGFASLQSDGEIQAHLSNIAVAHSYRRRGIARKLLEVAIGRAGGQRIDLVTDNAVDFYASFTHKRQAGFRIYPPFV